MSLATELPSAPVPVDGTPLGNPEAGAIDQLLPLTRQRRKKPKSYRSEIKSRKPKRMRKERSARRGPVRIFC